jgi:hypothetical protein
MDDQQARRADAKRARRQRRKRRRTAGARAAATLAVGMGTALAAAAPGGAESGNCTNDYASTVLGTPGLISFWRLGESQTGPESSAIDPGTTAVDQTGANNGAYEGRVNGGEPGSLTCDATTAVFTDPGEAGPGYVKLPTLDQSVTDFTIEGWADLTPGVSRPPYNDEQLFGASGHERLIIQPTLIYGDFFTGGDRTGRPSYGTAHGVYESGRASNTQGWNYFALVRSGATLTLYRDGSAVGSATGLPTDAVTLAGDIGMDPNRNYALDGTIDDVAVYSEALTAGQIQDHYNLAAGQFCQYGCGT